jgi:opacity protein-like surface antigen
MRRLLLAAFIAIVAQGAHAADPADLPVLRGSFREPAPSPTYQTVWQGFYVGGQAGYGVVDSDFTNATKDLTAKMLYNLTIENEFKISEWPLMSAASVHGKAFGGFAGYNAQFENVIVGAEVSFLHGAVASKGSGSMARSMVASDGYTYGVTSESTATMQINDFGSVRVRGGYIWGNALPYAFLGLGLGSASFTRTTHVFGLAENQNAQPSFRQIPFDYFLSDAKNNRLIFGLSGGAGIDYMLFSGLFLRAEFEITQFSAPIDTVVATGRAGLGYKF